METTGNIIAVYNKNKQDALQEFDALMNKTSSFMNEVAQNTSRYAECGGKIQIEDYVCPAIIKRIIRLAPTVKRLLSEQPFWRDIQESNPDLFHAKEKYTYWVSQISKQYPQIKRLKHWLMEV